MSLPTCPECRTNLLIQQGGAEMHVASTPAALACSRNDRPMLLDPAVRGSVGKGAAPGRKPMPASAQRELRVTRASEIPMRATRWLWEEGGAKLLPLGGLSLLAGREGIGKSTWGYKLAAELTTGKLSGAFLGMPRSVVVAAGEDAWAQTVVPRLAAAGADRERVMRVEVSTPAGMDFLTLPDDVTALHKLCIDRHVGLILLDPLMSTVSGKLDTHKDQQVRQALGPISKLAEDAQVGIVGLIHVSKAKDGDLLTRIMASRAFSAVARSVLFCIREEGMAELGRDDADETFLIGQPKSNLGRKSGHTTRYKINGVKVGYDFELNEDIWSSEIEVLGRVDRHIEDIVAEQERPAKADSRTATGRAESWLTSHLIAWGADAPESARLSAEVKSAAGLAGHSESTIKRVFDSMIETHKAGMVNMPIKDAPRRTGWFLLPAGMPEDFTQER